MSENEKRERLQYKIRRKRLILIQLIAICLLFSVGFSFLMVYRSLNKTYYIRYTESGSVDYKVRLQDNEFYDEEWLDSDHAYVTSLIGAIDATLKYGLNMENAGADIDYKYSVDAALIVTLVQTGEVLYDPTWELKPEVTKSSGGGQNISISENVDIDYAEYNDLAVSFINKHGLKNIAKANLAIALNVDLIGNHTEFDGLGTKKYNIVLNIPLAAQTTSIYTSSATPNGEGRITADSGSVNKDVFKTVGYLALAGDVLLLCILIAFIYLTRNDDINYTLRVKRILSSYRSYIQRIDGAFDSSDYQTVNVKTFKELLSIRDTIQLPILMLENEDQTHTQFIIPTNAQLLYVFDVKVDNYDEIYGAENGAEKTSEDEPVTPENVEKTEEIIEEQPVTEEIIEKTEEIIEDKPITEEIVIAQSESRQAETANSSVEYVLSHLAEDTASDNGGEETAAVAYIDESGNRVMITCARSFTANLIQSNPQVKHYYNEIKNRILSYKGVKGRISWRLESFKKGRINLFKLKIRGKTICLYCALDPNSLDKSKYFHDQISAKLFANLPTLLRIKSDRALKRALSAVDMVMDRYGIVKDTKAQEIDYTEEYPYDTTKSLVERKLIKILIPGVEASEPKPHHHVHKKVVEVVSGDEVEEIILFGEEEISEGEINEMAQSPDPELSEIDYDDSSEGEEGFVETAEKPGVEVIGVVWPERMHRNKIYRYDPDGETLSAGDIVIVPTRDVSRNRNVIRKAVVAHPNHKVDEAALTHPLKKIVGVVHKIKAAEDHPPVLNNK